MRRGGDAYTTVGCGHFALADLAETVKQGITTYCRWIARAGMPITVLVQVRPAIRPPPVGLTHARPPDTSSYARFDGRK